MSPRIFKEGKFVFWFHSYDVLHENRPSIHVGNGSQNDSCDAKIWLEPKIEIGRAGRTLNQTELNQAIKVIAQNLARIMEAWYEHKRKTE